MKTEEKRGKLYGYAVICFHRIEWFLDTSDSPYPYEELPESAEDLIRQALASDSYPQGELYICDCLDNGELAEWWGWWWINRDPNAPR